MITPKVLICLLNVAENCRRENGLSCNILPGFPKKPEHGNYSPFCKVVLRQGIRLRNIVHYRIH